MCIDSAPLRQTHFFGTVAEANTLGVAAVILGARCVGFCSERSTHGYVQRVASGFLHVPGKPLEHCLVHIYILWYISMNT